MTWSLSVPPLSSKVTDAIPAWLEALASSSAVVPEHEAPPEGTSTAVVGGWRFTVTLTGVLVSVVLSASVATLWRL